MVAWPWVVYGPGTRYGWWVTLNRLRCKWWGLACALNERKSRLQGNLYRQPTAKNPAPRHGDSKVPSFGKPIGCNHVLESGRTSILDCDERTVYTTWHSVGCNVSWLTRYERTQLSCRALEIFNKTSTGSLSFCVFLYACFVERNMKESSSPLEVSWSIPCAM